jgi:hypothetical protein
VTGTDTFLGRFLASGALAAFGFRDGFEADSFVSIALSSYFLS